MSQHPEIFGEMKVVCVNMEVIQFINRIIKWKWFNEVWRINHASMSSLLFTVFYKSSEQTLLQHVCHCKEKKHIL